MSSIKNKYDCVIHLEKYPCSICMHDDPYFNQSKKKDEDLDFDSMLC